MKIFGEELRKSIEAERQQILQNIEDRNRRIETGETDYDDCFISMRVSANALDACDKKLKILQGDGCMAFDAIFDENGDEVPIHYFENKWRKTTVVGRGVFASSVNALLKKTGWTRGEVRAPVWVKFQSEGCGRGMCGVYSGSYQYVRWHTNMVTGEYVGYPE